MMLHQYAAAALVSENKVLAHPASVDSIPTSANQEDHVSMGPIAARQARDILRNVEQVDRPGAAVCSAGPRLPACRAVCGPASGVAEAHARVRARVDHLDSDRDPQPDLAAAIDLVRTAALVDLARV